jgi:hypothetical protein
VDTVQACVMELSYRTASCHHDRLIQERTVTSTQRSMARIIEQRRVFLRSVEHCRERNLLVRTRSSTRLQHWLYRGRRRGSWYFDIESDPRHRICRRRALEGVGAWSLGSSGRYVGLGGGDAEMTAKSTGCFWMVTSYISSKQ